MKLSKYTFLFDVDNIEFYIYNTLSNALIEIDEDSYRYLLQKKEEKSSIISTEIDNEVYTLLVSKMFITENDTDGFLLYKSVLTKQRGDKSFLHLTLAPTMDCCFNCHYCFEKYKEKDFMSEDVMDSIISYLKSLQGRPELKLTWFGGEPLLALDKMELFYKKLVNEYNKPSLSNIITSGFHINENVIRVLQNLDVKQIQVTLDGLKETHNKVKYTTDCDDVFNKVLENVELLLRTSDIHVVIRVNLTKQNAHEYVEIYDYLMKRFKHYKNKGISPAFVMDRGTSNVTEEQKALFLHPNEAAKFVLELYHRYNIHSPFLRYPSCFFNECAIKNVMAISFDPLGYAYKCWEVIGNKEYAIGQLNNEGKLSNLNNIVLNRHLYGSDPLEDPTCSKCKYLPVCNGGCPIQRLENEFEGKKNCYCTFYKGYMAEFLKIHLKLKKNGIVNKPE